MRGLVPRALYAWEAVQVELQGRYSLQRFQQLLGYAKTSSRVKNLAVVCLTPLPGLLLLLFFDALPLASPHEGISAQTPALYIRLFTTGALVSWTFTRNIHLSPPGLPLSRWRHLLLTVAPSTANVLSFYALSVFWAFPPPFGLQIASMPMAATGLFLSWWTWKGVIRDNAEAKARAICFQQALMAQINLMSAYIVYYCAFTLVGKDYQAYVSLILPLLKMLFKNLIRKGLYYTEDIAPCQVVSSVDAFHSMYVSTTIQQAEGVTTTFFILLVDLIQSVVAYYEVVQIVRRVNKAAAESKRVEKYDSVKTEERRGPSLTASRLSSFLKYEYGVVDYANFLVETYPFIRDHPSVALPRHAQDEMKQGEVVGVHGTVRDVGPRARIIPRRNSRVGISNPQCVPVKPRQSAEEIGTEATQFQLTKTEQNQLACVTSMLKMLHMIEFYVLVEFVEVAVSVVYTFYVFVMSTVPNRIYYKQFSSLTSQQLEASGIQLAAYAALELLTFVIFCLAIDQQLQHISSFQQLAFTLKKEWKIVVPTLALWTTMVVQLTFEHNGMDYTFQFKWLRSG